jgi:hypothetical protein
VAKTLSQNKLRKINSDRSDGHGVYTLRVHGHEMGRWPILIGTYNALVSSRLANLRVVANAKLISSPD